MRPNPPPNGPWSDTRHAPLGAAVGTGAPRLDNHILKLSFNLALLKLTRHTLALLGLAGLAVVLVFTHQPAWRLSASDNLLGWLESRQDHSASAETAVSEAAVSPVTHMPTAVLSEDQAAVTRWLSRKYNLSPEPLGALVFEAWALGDRIQVSPTLLLAVMAIDSRFNPFASGSQGGIGLMQIEPQAHYLALAPFGGPLAAFDPLTNLLVGARHLQTLIEQSASVEVALQRYATSSGQRNGAEYANRVLAEQKHLETMKRPFNGTDLAQNNRL